MSELGVDVSAETVRVRAELGIRVAQGSVVVSEWLSELGVDVSAETAKDRVELGIRVAQGSVVVSE